MREANILVLDRDLSSGLGRELCGLVSSSPGSGMTVVRGMFFKRGVPDL